MRRDTLTVTGSSKHSPMHHVLLLVRTSEYSRRNDWPVIPPTTVERASPERFISSMKCTHSSAVRKSSICRISGSSLSTVTSRSGLSRTDTSTGYTSRNPGGVLGCDGPSGSTLNGSGGSMVPLIFCGFGGAGCVAASGAGVDPIIRAPTSAAIATAQRAATICIVLELLGFFAFLAAAAAAAAAALFDAMLSRVYPSVCGLGVV
eukprot:Amastigsp_a841495_34.p2 type:complete len:205 gc:universal Amastigsp_a841495_34:432-1046(+)